MFRLVILLACLGCASAHAQDARLSDRGRWLLSGSLRGSWSNNDGSQQRELPMSWQVQAAPSVLYFLRDRIALGAYELRTYEGVGPYDVVAMEVFPISGLERRWEWRHEVRPQAGLRLPIVYQVTSNLGFGVGPDLRWQRTSSGFNSLQVGLSSWIARAF